jgi:hypothetical protein
MTDPIPDHLQGAVKWDADADAILAATLVAG